MDSYGDTLVSYQLPSNKKGHYILDVVEYLIHGLEFHDGHATVRVLDELVVRELQSLEFYPVEWYDMEVADVQLDVRQHELSLKKLKALHVLGQKSQPIGQQLSASMHFGVEKAPNSIQTKLQHQEVGDIQWDIKTAQQPKKELAPFDMSREVLQDPRDPRANPRQWPCYGTHRPGKATANPHGRWTQCQVCNLRLSYVPRKNSTGQHTQNCSPHQCLRMLKSLHELLSGREPTAALCLAMQKKVDADTVLSSLAQPVLKTLPSPRRRHLSSWTRHPATRWQPQRRWNLVQAVRLRHGLLWIHLRRRPWWTRWSST